MKKRMVYLLLALTLTALLPFTRQEFLAAQSVSTLTVYYFHGTFRCYSCTHIEELTAKALRADFRGELASRKIIWSPVNIDDEKNRHYISDFSLRTRSVVLSRKVNGRQVEWKNLESVWDKLGDENAFSRYISAEVRGFLAK